MALSISSVSNSTLIIKPFGISKPACDIKLSNTATTAPGNSKTIDLFSSFTKKGFSFTRIREFAVNWMMNRDMDRLPEKWNTDKILLMQPFTLDRYIITHIKTCSGNFNFDLTRLNQKMANINLGSEGNSSIVTFSKRPFE